MLTAICSGFVLAALAPWAHRRLGDKSGWVFGLLPLGLFFYFMSHIPGLGQAAAHKSHDWIPSLGITLSFHADGLAILFAVLISGIGFLVTIYSGGYLHGHPLLGRWYAFLLMFMASMLGVVLSDNIIALFVFWELTSLSSYLLIGFHHREEASRYAALQALLVTGLGGLAMLAGLVMLGMAAGTLELSELTLRGDLIRNHPHYLPILVLVLLGAFTKSAQVPFHFWLPNAMAAPAPASAYLHSSTMVKAGVFLLARLSPALGGAAAWSGLVGTVGAATFLLGAFLAVQQHAMKRLLAYSTVSALGAMTMLLGVGTPAAVKAMAAFCLAHALYKAALFLAAGAVDHETGERDVRRLGGLAGAMPFTAAGASVAALSMAGIPLFFGFAAKELVYESLAHSRGVFSVVLTFVAVASSMLFLVVAACAAYLPFFGEVRETPKHPHEAPWSMRLGPLLLGFFTIVLGVLPALATPLLAPVAKSILGEHVHLHLGLWHGFSLALALSAATVAGGIAAFYKRDALCRACAPAMRATAWGPARWYDWSLQGMMDGAKWQTRVLQSGYLRYYLITIILATVAVMGALMITQGAGLSAMLLRRSSAAIWDLRYYELGVAAILVAGIAAVVHSKT
ncbi:MAG TPA: hypothetical protein ENN65_02210, partial [Candidatus Hydrogenedentes bacterium]|nr:hypothetical protein [Candidatus Hydrogenedentota bacterium]